MSDEKNEGMKSVTITREAGRVVASFPHTIKRHSQTGFEVGYSGSAPSDTALNLLLHVLGVEVSEVIYQQFKNDVISHLKIDVGESIVIPEVSVLDWADGVYSQNPDILPPLKLKAYRQTKARLSAAGIGMTSTDVDAVEEEAFGDRDKEGRA